MEKIFTVGFSAEKVADLGFSNIDLPSLVEKDDSEIHNFIINKFKENEIEKLIFDLSINPVLVLKLVFHIRLSLEELKSKSLLPILFTSTESFQTVIVKSGKWSSIFTTKGIYFAPLSLVKIDIENIIPLKSNEYKNSFLDLIQISPDEIDGKHSIANQWGAFALEQAANTNVLRNDENLKKTFNKLYFKYINAHLFDYKLLEKESHIKGTIYVGSVNTIEATAKKVLLIDDEADKGWDLVLRKIFKNADFKVINEKVSDYNSFSNETKQLIEHGNFDLFLVDLRLNGIQEEEIIPIELFSGTNVLKEIKRQNKGNQVIIFTASNKAWNIKPLLDFGADGYYIKESPEYMFSAKISESNYLTFKMNVNSCFNRNYLKNIFNSIEKLKIKLNNLIGVYDQKFLDEIQVLLAQSFDMHYNAKTEKQFAYAYVTQYMIFEIINHKFITKQIHIFFIHLTNVIY